MLRPFSDVVTYVRTRMLKTSSALLATMCACACGGVNSPVCEQAAALHGASDAASEFDLSPNEAQAIGMVIDDAAPSEFCSGLLVTENIALTARHCVLGGTMQFRIGADASAPDAIFKADEVSTHASLDLALLKLAGSARGVATPVAISLEHPDQSWIGKKVVMSGFGDTERGIEQHRLFLREELVAVTADTLTVWGDGETGACRGDSGGPLLIDGKDGAATVLGVLSKGAGSCMGIDKYQRLDSARSWLSAGGVDVIDAVSACDGM